MIVVLTSRPSPSPVVIICFAFSLPTSVPPSRSLTFFHLLFLFLLFFSHFISNFSFLRVLFISIIVFLHVLSIAFSFFSLLSPAFPFSVSFSYLFIYPSFFVFLSSSSPHLQRRKKAWVLQSVTKTDHVTLPLPLSPPTQRPLRMAWLSCLAQPLVLGRYKLPSLLLIARVRKSNKRHTFPLTLMSVFFILFLLTYTLTLLDKRW